MSSPVRAELRCAGWVTLALAGLGAPLGLLWSLLVPHEAVFRVPAGKDNPAYLLPKLTEDRASAAGDLVMLALLAATGLLVGALVCWWCRRRPVGAVVGLVAGGLLTGAIALAVGHLLVAGDYRAAAVAKVGSSVQVRPHARGSADVVVTALFGAAVALVVGAVPMLADRRRARRVAASSGTAAAE